MTSFTTLGAFALLLAAGAATALDPITIPGTAAGADDYYLVVDEATPSAAVWQESNGLTGLQTEPTILEDETIIPPDTPVA